MISSKIDSSSQLRVLQGFSRHVGTEQVTPKDHSLENTTIQPSFRVVLVEPEIPQNTGNIGRTCVATNAELHLVDPLGFEMTDRHLKRAGLDYWPNLKWQRHPSIGDWYRKVEETEQDLIYYFSTKAEKTLWDVPLPLGSWLVFGKETKGLDPNILAKNRQRCLRIPQIGQVRSLNLATAVAIAIYEGLRQNHIHDRKSPEKDFWNKT